MSTPLRQIRYSGPQLRNRFYNQNFHNDQDREERRGGTYIQKTEFEPLWFTIMMYALPVAFALLSIICISIDINVWRGERICEKKTNCQDNNNNIDHCTKFKDTVGILFKLYAYSLSSQVTKCGLILTFLSAHTVKNMPFVASFDMRTVQRGVAGIVIWGTVLLLDCAPIMSCVYRYTVITPNMNDWEQILFPKASEHSSLQASATLMINTMAAAFGSAIVCSVALARRITEVRENPIAGHKGDGNLNEETERLLEEETKK